MSWVALHAGGVLALVLLAWAVGRTTRRPALEHLVWVLLFVKLLLPPWLDWGVLPPEQVAAATHVQWPAPASLSLAEGGGAVVSAAPRPAGLESSGEFSTRTADAGAAGEVLRLQLVRVLPWALFALALAGLGHGLWRWQRFRNRVLRGACPAPAVQEQLDREALRLGLKRVPAAFFVEASLSPALVGLVRTRLVMPRDLWERLSAEQRRAVVVHELAHFARRDHWLRPIEALVLGTHWWLPPVWHWRRHLRRAEEAACDQRALTASGLRPRVYAETLLEVAGHLQGLSGSRTAAALPPLSTGALWPQPLEQRLTRIMQPARQRPLHGSVRLALLGLGLVAFGLRPVPAAARQETPPELPSEVQPLDLLRLEAVLEQELSEGHDRQEVPEFRERELSADEKAAMRAAGELTGAGDLAGALERLGALDPRWSHPEVDLLQAKLQLSLGRHASATQSMGRATHKDAANAELWRVYGLAQQRLGDAAGAAASFRQVIDLGDGDATIYGFLAGNHASLDEFADARSAYWMAHLLEPNESTWRSGLVQTYFQQGRYAEALELCDRLLASQTDAMDLSVLRANALLGLGRNAEAIDALGVLEEECSGQVEGLLTLGELLLNAGQAERAVRVFGQAFSLDFEAGAARVLRAVDFLIQARELDAAAELIQVVEPSFDPPSTALLGSRARLSLLRGDRAGALALLGRLEELGALSAEHLLQRARLELESGEVESARQSFGRALATPGTEPAALLGLGQLEVDQERYALALVYLEAAQALAPKDSLQSFIDRVRSQADSTPREYETEGSGDEATPVDPGEDAASTPPRVLYQAPPIMDAALRERAPAQVMVVLEVGPTGRVESPRVQESSDPAFNAAALDAVRQWRYEPGLRSGEPVAYRVRVPITFPGDTARQERTAEPRPEIEFQPQPRLTAALREQTPASLRIAYRINAVGAVEDATVEESSNALFDEVALEAVRKWRYRVPNGSGADAGWDTTVEIVFPGVAGPEREEPEPEPESAGEAPPLEAPPAQSGDGR